MSDTSLRLLTLPLDAMGAPPVTLAGVGGLPEGALDIAPAGLLVAATPCETPLFTGAIVDAARRCERDVLLIRTGFAPELLDLVTVDVALVTLTGPVLFPGLIFYRGEEGGLWLVPPRPGPVIAIRPDGLHRMTVPPFATTEARAAGVCRAAAEIVRVGRGGRC